MSQAFRLLLYFLSIHRLYPDKAPSLFSDCVTVVAEEESLFGGEHGKLETLLVMIEWSAHESGGDKKAKGKAGDFGRLQLVYPPAWEGYTPKEIVESPTLDLRLGLRWMLRMRDFCGGSVKKGLAAYARGSCTSEEGLKIATSRLNEINKALGK